jgi:hypothetical protein
MTTYYIEQIHTPFGILDEKGRECGVATWATVVDHESVRVGDTYTWQNVPVDPYVMVYHHALRGSSFYQAAPTGINVGLMSDHETRARAEAEIARRITTTRKRYERKYRKA